MYEPLRRLTDLCPWWVQEVNEMLAFSPLEMTDMLRCEANAQLQKARLIFRQEI